MKVVSLSSIIYQILYLIILELGFGGLWISRFPFVAGLATPPPAPPAAPPAPATPPPDIFLTTTEPTLSVFYDAMDECSQQFFNTTYINQCSCLCARIHIKLIPCQKATDKSGVLTCSSPADPTCKLNKIHSCAISLIPDQTQLMNYLACTMTNTKVLPDFATCATLHKVNDAQIQQCANCVTGETLCRGHMARVMEDMNTIPGFIFKKPEDIKTTDLFEHLDYFRNHVCYNNIQLAVCSQLKVIKMPSLPVECDQKLAVGIFYKTMDENTQKWFHALGSIFDKFSASISFKYQPCMFAELSTEGVLDCQDENDPDCLVGKTHACAVWLIPDPKTLYLFMNCTMQDTETTAADIQKCATDLKIPYDPIKACATSDRGKGLCYDSSKTRPNSGEVPMISFELTFDEATSKKTAAADAVTLSSIFCEQLKKYSIVLPAECKPPC